VRRIVGLITSALIAASLLPAAAAAQVGATDLASYVDPMIGTYPPGFVNPGAVRPFGLVAVGPDTEGPLNYGGYHYVNNTIVGFSNIHMSAGVPRGGQIPMMPVSGPVDLGDPIKQIPETSSVPAYSSPFSHAAETAEPGYYSVLLERYGIQAELTSTERVGVHRYTFLPGQPATVVIDPSRDLTGYHPAVVDIAGDRIVTGQMEAEDGIDVFFAAEFSEPFVTAQTFTGTTPSPETHAQGNRAGALLGFGDQGTTVVAKVGISFTDLQGALTNLTETEGKGFDEVRSEARAAWNDALGLVEVEGGTDAEKTSFYTALYHTQFFPNLFSDIDGRYRGFDDVIRTSTFPRYTQFSLWDSYRGQNQILSVIQPERYRDMIRSLLDMARQSGNLPRWTFANTDQHHMSGNPVIPFIGEGWCRGLLDDFDDDGDNDANDAALRDELFAQMRERTVNEPDGNYESLGYQSVPKIGQYPGGLPAVHELHDGGGGSAGTTLEFGLADMSLALMADVAGRESDREDMLRRAQFYRNLLDPETKWIRPRHDDGSWHTPFVPETDYGFQEGTSWQYSWLVMQDLAGLFDLMGGDAAVQERLDTFFNLPASGTVPVAWPKVQNQATMFGLLYKGNQYAPGNEHDLQAPFLYNYAGAPWKTQAVARGAASLYTPTPDGLPGNDDLGALSGWLVWTMLGVYPMTPGAPMYTVASPVFESAVVHRPGGEDLVISAPGASPVNKYVQSTNLDGEPLDATWFTETDGDELTVEMGPVPNMTWGTGEGAAPPSLSADPSLDSFGCVAATGGDTEPIATTLTYVGDTHGRGSTVRLAAKLLDAANAPIQARSVVFTIDGASYAAITGPDGIAETSARVTGHGRTQQVTAEFAGDEVYLSSTTQAQITWGGPV
jgi:predicted alpha-1,2-mannosidase